MFLDSVPHTLKKAYVLSVHAQTVRLPHFVNRPYELLSVTAIFM